MSFSEFFSLDELTRSKTAADHGISNQPDAAAIANLKALCTAVLDPLRAAAASPITVSSGYRGPALNAHIGGAKKSQHMEGKAADIQSSHITVLDLFKTVIRLGLPFDQVIFEAKNRQTKWVHVSHAPQLRGEILIAQFNDAGAVSYRAISAQAALDLTDPFPATRSGAPFDLEFEELADEPDAAAPQAQPPGAPRKKAALRKKVVPRKKAVKRKAAPPSPARRLRKRAAARKPSARRKAAAPSKSPVKVARRKNRKPK